MIVTIQTQEQLILNFVSGEEPEVSAASHFEIILAIVQSEAGKVWRERDADSVENHSAAATIA